MEYLITDVLNAYILNFKARQLSPKTVQSYSEILTQFIEWTGPVPIKDISSSTLCEYIM